MVNRCPTGEKISCGHRIEGASSANDAGISRSVMRTMPSFFVVGAAKAGTTAIHHALSRHPSVFLPKQKETNYFALGGERPSYTGPLDADTINAFSVWRYGDYVDLFRRAPAGSTLGEVSPMYLYAEGAASSIAASVPDARIVMCLREPLARAVSAYQHLVRDGRETETFERAIALEQERVDAGWEWFWHLTAVSMYADQVARYLDAFDRTQIRVYLYDDLRRDPGAIMTDLLAFIRAPPASAMSLEEHNVAGVPRGWARRAHRALYAPGRLNACLRSVLPGVVRTAASNAFKRVAMGRPTHAIKVPSVLKERFLGDVTRLERVIERDLSHWKARLADA